MDWSAVRELQPAGFELRLGLPGMTFFIGERIEGTLTFSNRTQSPYHFWAGTYDRSGRIPDIAFYATDRAGNPQPDPLRWYFERGGVGGGPGSEQDLSEWRITLPINEWIRFENPDIIRI